MTDLFCTYFDHRFLPQGLALLESLRKNRADFVLWVLCLDEACERALAELAAPEVRFVALAALEAADSGLREAKKNRTAIEYYFTCSPAWPLYLLDTHPEIPRITYLDADLYFFSDPKVLLNGSRDASVVVVPHRFPEKLKSRERFGLYNVGWISFKNDENGLACLRWWREQCIAWCYDRVEPRRFADQKYLDEWPGRFERVQIMGHKGANLAPWNLASFSLMPSAGAVVVEGDPLVFFHFHGLKRIYSWLYDAQLATYGVALTPLMRRSIYRPYIRQLRQTSAVAQRLFGRDSNGDRLSSPIGRHSPGSSSHAGRFTALLRSIGKCVRGLFYQNYVMAFGEWVV